MFTVRLQMLLNGLQRPLGQASESLANAQEGEVRTVSRIHRYPLADDSIEKMATDEVATRDAQVRFEDSPLWLRVFA